MQVVITMPVFEDAEASALLCAAIDAAANEMPDVDIGVMLIDDGSARPVASSFKSFVPARLESLSILTLRRNVGHQRAIALGLTYLQQHHPCDAVVVMDADGEDRPEDIVRLLRKLQESDSPVAVFAERGRRIESASFKLFYQCYRLLHYFATGRGIKIGNFSVLPARHLNAIVAYPELWNHYAAAVTKSRLPLTTIHADRAPRLRGKSQMNFVGLVIHGLSALFTYHEIVSTRLLIASAAFSSLFGLLLGLVVLTRVLTSLAIPGWASLVSGVLFLLIAQSLATSVSVMFSVMISRSSLGFLPLRDYSYFVLSCERIWPK